jgi:hypothetical protein
VFKHFFQARDELDRAVLVGAFDELQASALAIFRYLLEHTFFTERSYGFVNYDVCGVDNLIAYTRYSKNTVKRALVDLEDARLIHRRPRPLAKGGSNPDEITIIWAAFHAGDEAEGPMVGPSFLDKNVRMTTSSRRADDGRRPPSGENRAKEEFRIDPEDLEDLTRAINVALVDKKFNLPVPFSFARLGEADRARVPGLIDMLHREDPFDLYELIVGLVLEGDHRIHGIYDGARWLAHVLRGVSEAELRKWIARGKDHYAALERAATEAMERAERAEADRLAARQREEADRQARLEADRARAAARAKAAEEARKAYEEDRKRASEWVAALDSLDGVDFRGVGGPVGKDPVAYYISMDTKAVRPARGKCRLGEARIFVKRTASGPVLVRADL